MRRRSRFTKAEVQTQEIMRRRGTAQNSVIMTSMNSTQQIDSFMTGQRPETTDSLLL